VQELRTKIDFLENVPTFRKHNAALSPTQVVDKRQPTHQNSRYYTTLQGSHGVFKVGALDFGPPPQKTVFLGVIDYPKLSIGCKGIATLHFTQTCDGTKIWGYSA